MMNFRSKSACRSEKSKKDKAKGAASIVISKNTIPPGEVICEVVSMECQFQVFITYEFGARLEHNVPWSERCATNVLGDQTCHTLDHRHNYHGVTNPSSYLCEARHNMTNAAAHLVHINVTMKSN